MRLARVRRSAEAPVELVARLPRPDADGADLLLPLVDLPGVDAADPVLLATAGAGARTDAERQLAAAEPARLLAAAEVRFEPPVATCTKIFCLALNYREHAAEGPLEVPPEPVLFFKPPSALIGHGGEVVAPARTRRVEYEVELAIVIGRRARDVPRENWRDAVAGYTVINDMTARDLQMANIARNQPWDQAKGFDTFAPLGPYLVTPDEIPDPQHLDLALTVAGRQRQVANTAQMVFDIPTLIADLSDGMTLLPGDVIATGTIAGSASVQDGDVMAASVEHVGTLVNAVHFAAVPVG